MFNKTQVGRIQAAISLAVYKVGKNSQIVRGDHDDICQAAWVKLLKGYDIRKDRAATMARGLDNGRRGWTNVQASAAPEAYAYRVAYSVAIDHIKNLRKHGLCVLDAPITHAKDTRTSRKTTPKDEIPAIPPDVEIERRHMELDRAVAQLPATLKRGALSYHEDRAHTGSERIAKMRAVGALQEMLTC